MWRHVVSYFHLQGRPWIWKKHIPPKCVQTPSRRHGIKSHNIANFIVIAPRTSNPSRIKWLKLIVTTAGVRQRWILCCSVSPMYRNSATFRSNRLYLCKTVAQVTHQPIYQGLVPSFMCARSSLMLNTSRSCVNSVSYGKNWHPTSGLSSYTSLKNWKLNTCCAVQFSMASVTTTGRPV